MAAKLGLLTGPAVDYVGEVAYADLDVPAQAYEQAGMRVVNGAALKRLARRRDAHKGDFGRLLIVGGDAGMGGAVLLAAKRACALAPAWSTWRLAPSTVLRCWRADRS